MGLLDVNMPMLYGEGKKAFRRLQLEIMRTSNDQSIFAWGIGRAGSILADDPSFFRDCDNMELMDRDEFIKSLGRSDYIPLQHLAIGEHRGSKNSCHETISIQFWPKLCSTLRLQ